MKKPLFVVLGSIKNIEGKNRFIPKSPDYLQDRLNILKPGKQVSCVFSDDVAIRSRNQLSYHFVLMTYLSEYVGETPTDMHDAVMRLCFGEREIKLGDKVVKVRKSISDGARMPKHECVELISYDLKLCGELGIHVPTAESLGYVSNT